MTSNTQALLAGGKAVDDILDKLQFPDTTRLGWSLLVISLGVHGPNIHRLLFG
jgi:hypothetical protein